MGIVFSPSSRARRVGRCCWATHQRVLSGPSTFSRRGPVARAPPGLNVGAERKYRRYTAQTSLIYKFDEFVLDRGAFRLVRGQDAVHLKPRVLELLVYLVERQGRLITKQEILGELWRDRFVSDGVLSSSIYEARIALGDVGGEEHFIQTVH